MPAKPILQATLILSPRHYLIASSYLLSAFGSLGPAGAKLAIEIDEAVQPIVPHLRMNGLTYAIDLHDSNSLYCQNSLAVCDIYAKRSYHRAHRPRSTQARIIPFGLNYACRTLRSLAMLGGFAISHPRASRGLTVQSYWRLPAPEEFEYSPDKPAAAKILLQTRLWPEDELGPGDTDENVNQVRMDLVRELRKAFGDRFVGGLIPNPMALQLCPELVTKTAFRRRDYATFCRTPMIGVYCRGLHGSHGFKLAEYLASSKAIVGEPLENELPYELAGRYSTFRSAGECVSLCDQLLSRLGDLNEIRRASWQYYSDYIRYDRRLTLMAGEGEAAPADDVHKTAAKAASDKPSM